MTQPGRSFRGHSTSPEGGGVIWDGMPFETPVIPAKAGIQSFDGAFPKLCRADSRFRGNDCGLFATSLPREEGEECHLRQKNRSVLPHSTTPTRAQGLERRQLGVYCGSAGMPRCKFRPRKSATCFGWPQGRAFTGPEFQSKSHARAGPYRASERSNRTL